jgi:hypothetical protein
MAVFTAIASALTAISGWTITIGSLGSFAIGNFLLRAAVQLGVSALAQSLAGKPRSEPFSIKGSIRTGGSTPRSFMLGPSLTAGTLVWHTEWGKDGDTPNAYYTQVIALSDLPVAGLRRWFLQGRAVTLEDTGDERGLAAVEYRQKGKDHAWVRFHDGNQVEADPFLVGTVTRGSSRHYSPARVGWGVAYAVVTFRVHNEIFTGFPTSKFVVDGVKLYDASKDTTNGGTGAHRWDDPATWGGDGDALPAVQAYNLARGLYYSTPALSGGASEDTTIALGDNLATLSLEIIGGGGGGLSSGANGGDTVVTLLDGETVVQTWTASGGAGRSAGVSGEASPRAPYGFGAKGQAESRVESGRAEGDIRAPFVAGGAAGDLVTIADYDISGLANPILKVVAGAGARDAGFGGVVYNGEFVTGSRDPQWFYGLQGLTSARLPADHWISQIEKCRSEIEGEDGFEPLYRCAGEITVNSEIGAAFEAILTACAGRMSEVGGIFKIYVGAPDAPIAHFDDADIVSLAPQTFTPFYGLSDTINGVIGSYPSPDEGYVLRSTPPIYNAAFEVEDGGRRLMADVQLSFVPFAAQAQRLLVGELKSARRARRHTHTLPARFRKVEPGDVVTWTSVRNGYDEKSFRVDGVIDLPNCDLIIDITEVDASDHGDWQHGRDYTPVTIEPMPALRPAAQTVFGFGIEALDIQDGTGAARRPGLGLTWVPTVEAVSGIMFQVRLQDTGEMVGAFETQDFEAGSYRVSEGVLSATYYEARAKYIPADGRPVEWSLWEATVTNDVRLGSDDLGESAVDWGALDPSVRDQIDSAGDANASAQAAALAREAAKVHKQGAELARQAAEAAQSAAADAEAAAVNGASSSDAARIAAEAARDGAASSAGAADESASSSDAARIAAEAARDGAASSAGAADESASNSDAARIAAQAARDGAASSEAAAGNSASAAASDKLAAQTARDDAAGSASAASDSASAASASQTAAGNSASAAASDKLAAQTARDDAAGSASAASDSASAASASQTAAGNSASAAASDKLAAQTARDDAAGSASAASDSASAASASQTAAGNSASAASASKNTAATKAGEASTSAAQAATSKNDAAGSASSASTSATTAAQAKDTVLAISGNWDFKHGAEGWHGSTFSVVEGGPTANAIAVFSGRNKSIGWSPAIPYDPDRTYRLRLRVRATGADGPSTVYAGLASYSLDGTYQGSQSGVGSDHWGIAYKIIQNDGVWVEYQADYTGATSGGNSMLPDTAFVRPKILVNYGNDGNRVTEVDYFGLEDVTGGAAAESFASAAAVSASAAATKASEASQSASSASTSKNTAATKAGEASTSAGQAASSASDADAFKNEAASFSELAASSSLKSALSAREDEGFATGSSWALTGSTGYTSGEAPPSPQVTPSGEAKHSGKVYSTAGQSSSILWRGVIPVDTSRTYRIRVRYRVVTTGSREGGPQILAGLESYDKDGNAIRFNPAGNTWTYAAAEYNEQSDGWVERELVIAGEAPDTLPTNTGRVFRKGTVEVRPFAQCNRYSSGAVTEIDYLTFEDITGEAVSEGHAEAAATSASAASTKAAEASQSASSASTHANTASTKAGEASASAGQAASSKSDAAGSANSASSFADIAASAKDTAILVGGNPDFSQGYEGWRIGGTPSAADLSPGYGLIGTYRGRSNVFASNAGSRQDISQKKVWELNPNRRYRVRGSIATLGAGSARFYVGLTAMDADGQNTGSNGGFMYYVTAGNSFTEADGWQDRVSADFTLADVQASKGSAARGVALIARLNYDQAANTQALLDGIWIEDVTEKEEAQESASAAASSASTATAKASEASSSASSASAAANTASTKASQASTSATSAASAANTATGASATAVSARDTAVSVRNSIVEYAGNWDFSDGLDLWSSSGGVSVLNEGYTANKSLRYVGNGSLFSTARINIDFDRVYRVKIRIKVTGTATSKMYCGMGTFDAAGNLESTAPGSQRYCTLVGQQIANDGQWRVYEGIITGAGNSHHGQFRTTTVKAVPMALLNYQQGASSVVEVDYLGVEDITDAHEIRAGVSALETAVVDLEGNAAAALSFRAIAGTAGAELELAAFDDMTGAASLARIAADNVILEGTVTINHLESTVLRADNITAGRMSVARIDVDEILSIDAKSAGFSMSKTSPYDLSSDGIYMGRTDENGVAGFGFAMSYDNGSSTESIQATSQTGLKINNAKFFRDLAPTPSAVQVTSSQTVTLPAGTKTLSMLIVGGGGGGHGGDTSNKGGNGGNTSVVLKDGSTTIETFTVATGGAGGQNPTSGRSGTAGKSGIRGTGGALGLGRRTVYTGSGKGQDSYTAQEEPGGHASGFGAGGGGGGGDYNGGEGGSAGAAYGVPPMDISHLSNPKLVITIGAAGSGASGSASGGNGAPGLLEYTVTEVSAFRADVIPLEPTATGTMLCQGPFPNLGAGFWVLSRNVSGNMDFGDVEINDSGKTIRMHETNSMSFVSSKTPVILNTPYPNKTINYQFFKMGS